MVYIPATVCKKQRIDFKLAPSTTDLDKAMVISSVKRRCSQTSY